MICKTEICTTTIGKMAIHTNKIFKETIRNAAFVLFFSCLTFAQGGVATGDLHVTVKIRRVHARECDGHGE